jgi:hypothetical protein
MKFRAALLVGALIAVAGLSACTQGVQQDLNQISPAEDVQAQTNLQSAATAAQSYLSGSATASFEGFNAAAATQEEPEVVWTDGAPATEGQVSIRAASGAGVVLVSKSKSGTVFCVSVSAAGVTKGKQDAQSPAQCIGGW